VSKETTVEQFKHDFPLGSATRVVAVDEHDTYAGIVIVSDAYGELDEKTRTNAPLVHDTDNVLTTPMNIQEAARAFERTEAEALAVVDLQRRVVGLLTEAYVLRRYADESERRRREILGEV
jgi:CIC family chloride channel protein